MEQGEGDGAAGAGQDCRNTYSVQWARIKGRGGGSRAVGYVKGNMFVCSMDHQGWLSRVTVWRVVV